MRIPGRTQYKNFDWLFFALIMLLCLIGLVCIMNATCSPFAEEEGGGLLSRIDWGTTSLQLMWVGLGTAVLFIMQLIDYHVLGDYTKLGYVITLALLTMVLIIGSNNRGTSGWFTLFGSRTFQPSEVGKLALIVVISKLVSDKLDSGGIETFRDVLLTLGAFIIPFVLIMLQPDWGTAFVYACILFGILFAAKVSFKIMGGIIASGVAALPVVYFVLMQDWQRDRILSFFDPARDTSGSGMNVANSKIAIGSGGLFGKGLFAEGNLSQLDYVPEKHTDFIFAATAESVGFVGGLLLLLIYVALIARALYIASHARDKFGYLLVVGVVAMEMFHIFENVGMTMGVMPVTGIPLPFVSYGGSSMLTNMIAMGLVLNVGTQRQKLPTIEGGQGVP